MTDKVDAAYRRTAASLADNPAVTIVEKDGKARLKLSPLDRLDEPASLVELRRAVGALLPKVDVPEVVLEVACRTGFAEEFTHVSEAGSRAEDLVTSICAVLVAEACNVGLEPMVRQDVPALRRGRLAWVEQNYLRAETLARANARLVAYHAELPLARIWGGGEVASVDGLRFVVPVPSVHAGRNPKYYGLAGRGVTYLNYVSNRFSGFHAIVVPGTLRDSMFILDGLLEQRTVLDPTEVMPTPPRTRTGCSASSSCSATSSAPAWPTSARRGSRGSTPGPTTGRSTPWRGTGSIRAHQRQLGGSAASGGLPRHRQGQALRVPPHPAGRLALGDPRRRSRRAGPDPQDALPARVHRQPDLPSSHPRPAQPPGGPSASGPAALPRPPRPAPPGLSRRPGGPARGARARAQYPRPVDHPLPRGAALDQLDRSGHAIDTKDLERLSPLKFRNVNLHGRYSFILSEEVARGALRPLRNGGEPDEEDVEP